MIRLVFANMYLGDAIHGGAQEAKKTLKSFDVSLPEIEEWLADKSDYNSRTLIGMEIIEDANT